MISRRVYSVEGADAVIALRWRMAQLAACYVRSAPAGLPWRPCVRACGSTVYRPGVPAQACNTT